jgi:hypothetical protein
LHSHIGRVIGSGTLDRLRADQESAKAGFWENKQFQRAALA